MGPELRRGVDVRERIDPVRPLLRRGRDRSRRKLQSAKGRFRAGRAINLRGHTRHRNGNILSRLVHYRRDACDCKSARFLGELDLCGRLCRHRHADEFEDLVWLDR